MFLQPEQPYLIRAKAFKEELSITTKLEEKIEAKEQEMLEIKMAMKLKVRIVSNSALLLFCSFANLGLFNFCFAT